MIQLTDQQWHIVLDLVTDKIFDIQADIEQSTRPAHAFESLADLNAIRQEIKGNL